MPTLEELEIFKQFVNELGDEARILQERGKILEDITPPSPMSQHAKNFKEGPEEDLIQEDIDLDSVEDLGGFDELNEELSEEILKDEPEEREVPKVPAAEEFEIAEDLTGRFAGDEEPETVTEDLSAEEPEMGTEDLSAEEPETVTEDFSVEEPETVTEDFSAEEPETVTEDLSTEEPETVTEDLSAEEPETVTEDFSVEEPETVTEDFSVEELSLDDVLNLEDETKKESTPDEVTEERETFSIDDFEDQYRFHDEAAEAAEEPTEAVDETEETPKEGPESFVLNEDDYRRILAVLTSLPRNLKIAIEEIFVDNSYEAESIQPLVKALLAKETPRALVLQVQHLTGRRVILPKDYKKRPGELFETRRLSPTRQLIRKSLPALRVVLLIFGLTWLLIITGFSLVYRPLKADSLYRMGLQAISVDDIESAERLFDDAWFGWSIGVTGGDGIVIKGWPNKSRLLDYARTYRLRKHWSQTGESYRNYLNVQPGNTAVRLEYSGFLAHLLGEYEEAIDLLEEGQRLERRGTDRDLLLAEGDVYLAWAENDARMFEEARYRYAKVLETSRNDERAMLSMMNYHLKIRDDENVERLLPFLLSLKPERTEDPERSAAILASLSEYLLNRGRDIEARKILDLAHVIHPLSPHASFAEAAYRRFRGDGEKEMAAHRKTLINLEGKEFFTRDDLKIRILSLGGMGRLYALWAAGRPGLQETEGALDLAREYYRRALDLYEDASSRNLLGTAPQYAALYVGMADTYYGTYSDEYDLDFTLIPRPEVYAQGARRTNELRLALQYYDRAAELYPADARGDELPDASLYRRGFIRYVLGETGALVDFYRVVRRRSEDGESRLSLATSLLRGGDYEASRSQYLRALELLDRQVQDRGGTLEPENRPGYNELLLRYAAVWNNLGVARALSAARGGSDEDYGAALGAFTMASEYLDQADFPERGAPPLRDEEERRIWNDWGEGARRQLKETFTIPYLNRTQLLEQDSGDGGYQIFTDIPGDAGFTGTQTGTIHP